MAGPKISAKQQKFIEEYLKDLNGTQAAIRAGYSENSAQEQSSRLLSKPHIQEAIKKAMAERAKRNEITADMVLKELAKIGMVDLGNAYGQNGELLPVHNIPEDTRRAIAGIEVFEEYEGHGDNREYIGDTKKVRFYDKVRALELIGKHLGMFVDRSAVEHSGPGGGPIKTKSVDAMTAEERKSELISILKSIKDIDGSN